MTFQRQVVVASGHPATAGVPMRHRHQGAMAGLVRSVPETQPDPLTTHGNRGLVLGRYVGRGGLVDKTQGCPARVRLLWVNFTPGPGGQVFPRDANRVEGAGSYGEMW